MYKKSMKTDGIIVELKKDIEEASGFVRHKMFGEVRRAVIKTQRFPVYKLYDWHSTSGNTYIIRFYVPDKKCLNRKTFECDCAYYAIMSNGAMIDAMNYLTGMKAVKFNGKHIPSPIKIYTPHFFQRYEERYGLVENNNDIVRQFIRHSDSTKTYTTAVHPDENTKSHGGQAETLTIWKDGISLGVALRDDCILVNTFLSYDVQSTEKQKKYVSAMAGVHQKLEGVYEELLKEYDKNRIVKIG